MKIAALYDIHGNLPALQAVLKEIERSKVDQIVVGGDVVLGPMSRECLDLLESLKWPVSFIQGNCEVHVVNQMQGNPVGNFPENVIEEIKWTASQLDISHLDKISGWPKTILLNIDGLGKVLFCHATPRDQNEIFTRMTTEEILLPIFNKVDADIVVCGHTHMQFDRTIGDVRVINAGSVGMSYGKKGAHWLLIGDKIQHYITEYNLSSATTEILKTNYPFSESFVKEYVLTSPSEKLMMKILGRAELK